MTQPATRVHLPNPRLLKCVWEDSGLRNIKGSRLLLLLALVQHTSRNADTMWPSIRRLAYITRLSVRQVLRVLEDLERRGWIERDKRGRGRIYKMGAAIQTAVARIGDARDTYAEPIGDTGDMSQVTPATEIGDTGDTRSMKEDTKGSMPGDELEGFDAFWASYPRKVSKKDALKAFRETRRTRPPTAQLLAALGVFTGSKEWQKAGGQYVPYPATWLRDERWRDVEAPAELEAGPGRAIPSEQDWRAALAALAAEKYPDADCSRFRRWEDLPDSLQAEVREVMAGAPADWRQLLRIYWLMNNDDPTRTFASWDRAPSYVRADLRALAAEMEQSPAPEGWAAAIALLKDAEELPAGDAYEAWPAVPLWLRAQVRLLLDKSAEETETQGGTQHENTAE